MLYRIAKQKSGVGPGVLWSKTPNRMQAVDSLLFQRENALVSLQLPVHAPVR